MRLCVVGLGMVGLPTALLFAESGHDVIGVDVHRPRLEAYRRGESDRRLEPDIADLLAKVVARGSLTFEVAPQRADVTIIAVGTPLRDGAPDLGALRSAVREVAPLLAPGDLLVIESTVPPGTTQGLVAEFSLSPGVLVGHAPERVSPGSTLREMRVNPRVVGGVTREAGERIASLYACISSATISITDATTAEFVKLIENTYRDVNIALANELLLIASRLGIDAWRASELANAHPRVQIHRPGPGVGGHCIGVAPHFLRAAVPDGVDLLMAARERNDAMPRLVARQILRLAGGLGRPRVAILGVAYKPDVADDRDSPSLAVAAELRTLGADVRLHDPLLLDAALEDVLGGADVVALLVAHTAYRPLDPSWVGGLARERRILDATHVLDRTRWEAEGFTFRYLGEATPAFETAAR